MKPTLPILVGLVLLLLSPSVDASFTDVREYQRWLFQANDADGIIPQTNVVVPANPHGFTISSRASNWVVTGTYQFFSVITQAQQVDYQFEVDGTDISGCIWRVSTVQVTFDARLYNHFRVTCMNSTAVNPGTHSIEIKGTVTGANPVSFSRVDVVLIQTDVITDATLDTLATTSGQLTQHQATRTLINTTSTTTQDLVTGHNTTMVNQHTIQGLYSHCQQTASELNDCEGLRVNLTAVHGHIDTHFATLCTGGSGCNITVNNTPVLEAVEAQQLQFLTMDPDESWTFLLFLAMLLVCYWQRWLFVAIACMIGIVDMWLTTPVLGFKGTALLMVVGVVLQILVDMRDAYKEKEKEKEEVEASGN